MYMFFKIYQVSLCNSQYDGWYGKVKCVIQIDEEPVKYGIRFTDVGTEKGEENGTHPSNISIVNLVKVHLLPTNKSKYCSPN